uniref:Uncharacterized protein n=1 Tax=Amphimedon queenslandica TaxID=400682 RepID=A0A1X7V2E1_AMPQE
MEGFISKNRSNARAYYIRQCNRVKSKARIAYKISKMYKIASAKAYSKQFHALNPTADDLLPSSRKGVDFENTSSDSKCNAASTYLYRNDDSDSQLDSPIAIPIDTNGICYVAGIVDVPCRDRVEECNDDSDSKDDNFDDNNKISFISGAFTLNDAPVSSCTVAKSPPATGGSAGGGGGGGWPPATGSAGKLPGGGGGGPQSPARSTGGGGGGTPLCSSKSINYHQIRKYINS